MLQDAKLAFIIRFLGEIWRWKEKGDEKTLLIIRE
jgi:hypothetical protein